MSSRREYPERPIPGVGAVVLRESHGRAEVVLVRRSTEPLAGSWSLPGGAIELGETAREACARELLEETGLTVRAFAEVETIDIILHDDAGRVQFHYLIVDILCRVLAGELLAGEDASEAVWAEVQSVLERGDFALTPRACTVIRKALVMNEDVE
jgi:8-oxo-dGTP diphosphatase